MRFFAFVATLAMVVGLAAVAQEGKTYGKGLGKAELVQVSELTANPENYVGKTVRVQGVVLDVCAKRGCWMEIASDAKAGKIRIKVEDGAIVFPMDAVGKQATAEGVFTKIEMTQDEARALAKHQAEERGQALDATKEAEAPKVVYQIQGTGAVIR